MPRKLKTYQTSQGFYDLTVAAPSMKAALKAWGANSNLFHQGLAKETDDSDVIEAAMAKPGVVLKRPVGSDHPFREHSDLPTIESFGTRTRQSKGSRVHKSPSAAEASEKETRTAALAYEREQQRREKERQKQVTAAAKARERREAVVAETEAALEAARHDHEAVAAEIEKERIAIERRAEAEDARWGKKRKLFEAALRKARE